MKNGSSPGLVDSLSWQLHTPLNWLFLITEARHQTFNFLPPYRLEWADASSDECETHRPLPSRPALSRLSGVGCSGSLLNRGLAGG